MRTLAFARRAALMIGLALAAAPALAADFPAPRDHSWVARDFRFHTGEVMPELRIGYTTVGDPGGIPVLVLHGTAGNARNMLVQSFAGQLFGEGQPLDARRHFIIIPDAIGTGRSSKPSDGLRGAFPRYNYDDMVDAQHRLVTEGLGIPRLRLVIGNSMGGMHAWLWGTNYPEAMDAIVPMASQPTEMSSRNWMMRRLLVESVRRDPGYANGFYTQQPASLGLANVVYATATNGGTLNLQKIAPTREAADRLVEQRLAAPPPADANDFVYQWDSSRDYNPAPRLERIRAQVLAINAADDERNPPETGLMQAAMQRVAHGRLLLIPASAETLGHGTTSQARFWAEDLRAFLRSLE
ncbi:alpha/beta fold hydrolase [Falsiroseomonas sp.]|uniref:alpha/beta fold hydrolase n=1 Tax=Falsiroseomonas sp. TaxID=2870721 RepID=UPI003F703CC9